MKNLLKQIINIFTLKGEVMSYERKFNQQN